MSENKYLRTIVKALDDKKGNNFVRVDFNVSDAEYNVEKLLYCIGAENLKIEYSDDENCKEVVECAKATEIEYLSFSRCPSKNIHYVV